MADLFTNFKVALISLNERIEELNKNKNFKLAYNRAERTKTKYEKELVAHVKSKPSQA